MVTQDPPRSLATVQTNCTEVLVKTHRWLTLAAALLITLCEVLIFNSQSAREPERQANAGAATDAGGGRQMRRSPARTASIYWAAVASETQSPKRVR
jgi:hypothetical protein